MNTSTEQLKQAPVNQPGVYFFKNNRDEIIYIGKARSLRNRIRSYFAKNQSWKIISILQELDRINYLVTSSEPEAALLEAQLIKSFQPKYNILLKNGQPFVYLRFTKTAITLVRNKKESGRYIGPFLSKIAARRVHTFLVATFKLACCKKKVPNGCLKYHLGTCSGTCRADFNLTAFGERLMLAYQAVTRQRSELVKDLKNRIGQHNQKYEFESAKQLYEYLSNLEIIFHTLSAKYNYARYAERITQIACPPISTQTAQEVSTNLQAFLGMEKPIRTIDCFDISHFQSSSLVGACVRFTNGIVDKDKLRRFKIKTLTEQNDYAALQEIVSRRYKDGDQPDLILVDGGKGQLNAVAQLMLPTACISLAKREERIFFTQDTKNDLVLNTHCPNGKLLIALRDYAHHFAITYHRTLQKRMIS